jgi:hypothetical protein
MVAKNEIMFHIVGFLARKVLGIVGSHIETKKIFSLIGILTNLRRFCLRTKNLEKLIFVNKNWPNDSRIGYKSSSNFLEFLERDMDLEEELEEFEGDEVVEV